MNDIREAINYYHNLLTDDVAAEADGLLRRRLRERGLYFGDRPLCIVLRPHLYFEDDWFFIKRNLDVLLTAFQRVHDICLVTPSERAKLRMDDYEEALIPYDRATTLPWTSSRLDTFFRVEKRTLKCVEYNAETPAGIGYGDVLNDVFEELEPIKRFRQRYDLRAIRSLGMLADALLTGYHTWGGRENPQIAILDWGEVPTLSEHVITSDYLHQRGIVSILADPRALEYRDGHLWHEDFRIDMIYKRVLYSELIQRMGLNNPVCRAIRDNAVYITNAISAKMLAKKASLAFMSDEQNAHYFTPDQHQAIQAYIPWTRVIEERHTLYDGQKIDLLPYLEDHRERFVLKPNDEYGGSGVILGWECSGDVWRSALQNALETPYVIQERVEVVQRDFPTWINNALDISPRFVDADPYVFGGNSVAGCMTRVSSLSLLNVTAGGGSVVPTMIIRPK